MNICILEKENYYKNNVTIEELNTMLENQLELQDDILDENDFTANIIFFNENYTIKQLGKIADYYKIKKSRKKEFLINDIVLFEMDKSNSEIVMKRKLLDYYLECLLEDDHYKKFILNI